MARNALKPVYVSAKVYPSTLQWVKQIAASTGETMGAVFDRISYAEVDRLRKKGDNWIREERHAPTSP